MDSTRKVPLDLYETSMDDDDADVIIESVEELDPEIDPFDSSKYNLNSHSFTSLEIGHEIELSSSSSSSAYPSPPILYEYSNNGCSWPSYDSEKFLLQESDVKRGYCLQNLKWYGLLNNKELYPNNRLWDAARKKNLVALLSIIKEDRNYWQCAVSLRPGLTFSKYGTDKWETLKFVMDRAYNVLTAFSE